MLKKRITATITAATRLCIKCGATITPAPIGYKVICECGEVVYDAKNNNSINGETAHEKA